MQKYGGDFDEAYPMAPLLGSDIYKLYLRDPFEEGALDNVMELF